MRYLIDTKAKSIDQRSEFMVVVLYVSIIVLVTILMILLIETAA